MASHTEHLQCMEVWGGNTAADNGVAMPGLDAWVYSRPWRGEQAGGDVHYVSSCASGRIVRMMVADVSGHGEQAADTARRLRAIMRRYVNHLDQRRFVSDMSAALAGQTDDGRFATAAVFTYFGPTRTLTLSNAGHPPPLIFRCRTGRWDLLAPADHDASMRGKDGSNMDQISNLPLGITERGRYDALAARIETGDMVLCCTDSLIEARGSDGRMLGSMGLLRVVEGLQMTDPSAIIAALLNRVAVLAPGNLEGDDVTVLLFRANGSGMKYTIGERLATYGRVLKAVGRALTFRERFPWPDLHMANIGGAFIGRLNQRWRGGSGVA